MPSRKKERGRQNRAKKETVRIADLRSHKLDAIPSCEHRVVVLRIPQEGPAVSFMNHIAGVGFFSKATIFPNAPPMKTCFSSLSLGFPGVRKEDNERALAIDLLLRFVRNAFVHDSTLPLRGRVGATNTTTTRHTNKRGCDLLHDPPS